ncbi:hypothetical protein AcW2_000029 [Taiwanofungus camphoratus]|nr:hypothetical protein AcW2_000029 [Antrodia cinnamomea]
MAARLTFGDRCTADEDIGHRTSDNGQRTTDRRHASSVAFLRASASAPAPARYPAECSHRVLSSAARAYRRAHKWPCGLLPQARRTCWPCYVMAYRCPTDALARWPAGQLAHNKQSAPSVGWDSSESASLSHPSFPSRLGKCSSSGIPALHLKTKPQRARCCSVPVGY